MIIEETQMDEKQFFDKARQVAKAIDQGEYKVCSLEEAEAFAEKRKASAYELADKLDWHWDNDCRSPAVSKSADMLRQQANRIDVLEANAKIQLNIVKKQQDYIDQLEKGLESVTEFSKVQIDRISELERKHKEEFDYAEKLLKERNQ
jgi:hypothetical protein